MRKIFMKSHVSKCIIIPIFHKSVSPSFFQVFNTRILISISSRFYLMWLLWNFDLLTPQKFVGPLWSNMFSSSFSSLEFRVEGSTHSFKQGLNFYGTATVLGDKRREFYVYYDATSDTLVAEIDLPFFQSLSRDGLVKYPLVFKRDDTSNRMEGGKSTWDPIPRRAVRRLQQALTV